PRAPRNPRTSPPSDLTEPVGPAVYLKATQWMTMRKPLVALVAFASIASAQTITTPKQEFGHNFGDDYWLANYKQISTYWQKLARQSNRMKLVDMGKTA